MILIGNKKIFGFLYIQPMRYLKLYENFVTPNAIQVVDKNITKITLQYLYDEMTVFNKKTKQWKDKYKDNRFVDYLDNLIVGKYVTYDCIECQTTHSGILEETEFEDDEFETDDGRPNLIRVKFKLRGQDWDMHNDNDHMVNVYEPIIINKIGVTTDRFDL